MAIKLGKILKKMQSFGRTTTTSSSSSNQSNDNHGSLSKRNSTVHVAASNLWPVYVGKTRRCYMVSSDVVGHPLFRELIVNKNGNSEEIRVGCEVVLFEHLLWMLDNVVDHQVEALDELVDFYAC